MCPNYGLSSEFLDMRETFARPIEQRGPLPSPTNRPQDVGGDDGVSLKHPAENCLPGIDVHLRSGNLQQAGLQSNFRSSPYRNAAGIERQGISVAVLNQDRGSAVLKRDSLACRSFKDELLESVQAGPSAARNWGGPTPGLRY
jgi:hypothetical protein